MSRVARVWERERGKPFDDLAREQYAQARAKGGTIKASAQESGVSYRDAVEWDKHPTMLERVRELRQHTTQFVDVSVAWVIGQLKQNADLARDEGQLKSSNEALKLIYDIIRTDPSIAAGMARQLPPTMSTRAIKQQLLKSLKGEPAASVTVQEDAENAGDACMEPPDEDDDEAAQ